MLPAPVPPAPIEPPPAASTAQIAPPPALSAAVSAALSAGAQAIDGGAPATPIEAISEARAEELLFPPELGSPGDLGSCRAAAGVEASILCLLDRRYNGPAPAGDPEGARSAAELYRVSGAVAGLLPREEMDGGFRGQLLLLPELPVGTYRRHLGWVLDAHRDFERFFADLRGANGGAVRFRTRALAYRFFRSHKRTTPSAYAQSWTVAYNVVGSLNTSASAVRETLFHEIFHLNDFDHGDWSPGALGSIYDAIVHRCGTKMACLRPFTPTETTVRGGTYYAFQPDNGQSVHEYAAELATRYYLEQEAAFAGKKRSKPPFKCGPPENRTAWEAIAKEFFGGVDRVPSCDKDRSGP
ncbi:MAG: hypothetical protein U0359_04115 [Byssovorax sp.]